ncbi:Ubiquitin carrier protein-related [Plasmodium yoelii yoelii]|uniref:Ubiquitin carrier protein-related n=1 Tax=Plasmodium yoelii yoelii TaxID=73239 RepID=Q7RIL6_PLAYO|nr:Ubiquitin carrier protein-related [Plasmodium yoelii yoelii]
MSSSLHNTTYIYTRYKLINHNLVLKQGGIYNATLSFPSNFPNQPPQMKFNQEMWHPNVYPDGRVCISILHPPGMAIK